MLLLQEAVIALDKFKIQLYKFMEIKAANDRAVTAIYYPQYEDQCFSKYSCWEMQADKNTWTQVLLFVGFPGVLVFLCEDGMLNHVCLSDPTGSFFHC